MSDTQDFFVMPKWAATLFVPKPVEMPAPPMTFEPLARVEMQEFAPKPKRRYTRKAK